MKDRTTSDHTALLVRSDPKQQELERTGFDLDLFRHQGPHEHLRLLARDHGRSQPIPRRRPVDSAPRGRSSLSRRAVRRLRELIGVTGRKRRIAKFSERGPVDGSCGATDGRPRSGGRRGRWRRWGHRTRSRRERRDPAQFLLNSVRVEPLRYGATPRGRWGPSHARVGGTGWSRSGGTSRCGSSRGRRYGGSCSSPVSGTSRSSLQKDPGRRQHPTQVRRWGEAPRKGAERAPPRGQNADADEILYSGSITNCACGAF